MVGGRDSPHGVFDPWVRWDPDLDRIRSFRVVVVVVVSPFLGGALGAIVAWVPWAGLGSLGWPGFPGLAWVPWACLGSLG